MIDALTLGVVGHVDHGKTALVRALTGIETDRLKEERERGLSIVLGFAWHETTHGIVDLIDVPGHENFIRAMVSGATALDGVMLCVAANEGVKPQTVEHLNIASLLGVDRGIVVVTKADLADGERLQIVRNQLVELLQGTFLEAAPIVEVSAETGQGMDSLRDALEKASGVPVDRVQDRPFFLPLDRVFTMRGFGVIGTGTLRGGELAVGDTVEILPGGRHATVRGLQNHNRSVDRVCPGQRVAANLRQVDRSELQRGSVLAAPDSVQTTRRIDIEIRLLGDPPQAVRNGTHIRLLTGTTEVIARLRLLDRRELGPGERAVAQLSLDAEIATRVSEHCLIRSVSPMHTIGGGRVLEVNPGRHRRFDTGVRDRLETAASGDLELILAQRLEGTGLKEPLDLNALAREQGVDVGRLREVAAGLGGIDVGGDRLLSPEACQSLETRIVACLNRFHEDNPLTHGLDLGALVSALRTDAAAEAVRYAVKRLASKGTICATDDTMSLTGFDPLAGLNERQRQLSRRIEQAFRDGRFEPPSAEAVVGSDKASRDLFRLLLESGRLVRLKTYDRKSLIVLHAEAVGEARTTIEQEYPYPRAFALKEIRDLLKSTRKFVVPLMEHFDATGFTIRSGDLRRLKQQVTRG